MPVRRRQVLAASLSAVTAVGGPACTRPAVSAASTAWDASSETQRRPDAVVLDPEPGLPEAATRSDASGVVSLREPASGAAVAELVASFFDAWQHESLDGLLALLASDAGAFDGGSRGRSALIEGWRLRLRAHAYGRLAGVELVRPEKIERFEWDELGVGARPARPPGMHKGEVFVRAPVEVTRVAGEKLFGDVVTLVLRRQDGALRIAAYDEADAP